MNTQGVILDATLERSVIRGTLTAPAGERREFHGWLELNTALEAILAPGRPSAADASRTATTSHSSDSHSGED